MGALGDRAEPIRPEGRQRQGAKPAVGGSRRDERPGQELEHPEPAPAPGAEVRRQAAGVW